MDNIDVIDDVITLKKIIDHFSFFLGQMAALSPYPGHDAQANNLFDYFHSLSDDLLLNGIFIHDVGAVSDYSSIKEKLHCFDRETSPYTLWMSGESTSKFNEFLDSEGLEESAPLICIGARLEDINQLPVMPDLLTKPVTNKDDYNLYIDILTSGFEFSDKARYEFNTMLTWYERPDSPLKHYIGYLKGEPVSVISTVRYQDALGMYCGTTLPQYQRLGICTELYRYTMDKAKKSGCKTCVYQSSVPAIINQISKKFDFKEYGLLRRFIKQKQ